MKDWKQLDKDAREDIIVLIVIGAIILLVVMTVTTLHGQGVINLWK